MSPPRRLPWLAVSLAITLLWALGASFIILFHDEVLAGFVARQGLMRTAYEVRIGDLQDLLDRGRSDRAGTESALAAQVAAALERQAELERRQAALAALANPALSDARLLDPPTTGGLPASLDGLGLRPAESVAPFAASSPLPIRRSAHDAETGLIRLEARLDGLQSAQGERLGQLAERAGDAVRRLRGLIARTGLDPVRLDPRDTVPATTLAAGGPLVLFDAGALGGAGFEGTLVLARRALGDGQRLRRLAAELPLRRPIRGEAAVSSPFGTRLDPFTRGLALHTGVDLKADYGAPARATAPGIVVTAEGAGGYGNMVEIDHGHGLTTRFGHLARIEVRPGQRVAAGETIGLVGSTGRSTGAHLHYETRIDGEPVDPQRFLDAGHAFETAQIAD